MTPEALLEQLEARGVRLARAGEQLTFEAPEGTLGPEDLEALRAHKVALLALVGSREGDLQERFAGLPLRALDQVLELAVPWWPETLLLAPSSEAAAALCESIDPGRVWSTSEVLALLAVDASPDAARAVAECKLLFAGTVTGVRREAA